MNVRPMDHASESELRAVLELFSLVYGRELSPEFYRWRFLANPFGPPLVTLLWDGDTLAGHYSASPMRSFCDGEFASAQSMTTMTHPDYRNQGVFTKLAEDLYARMPALGVEMIWGWPNTQSHYGFVQRLGWSDVGVVVTMTRHLTGKERSAQLPTELPGPAPWMSGLFFESAADGRVYASLRDAAYLRWRYVDNPGRTYRFFALGDRHDVVAVTTDYTTKEGKRALEVVDYLHGGNTEAFAALLEGLAALAREDGCAMVRTWMGLDDPGFPALERQGFTPREPLTYFGARVLGARKLPGFAPAQWRLTMGDSDNY
ncbi:MAG: GNAT family N-acetyltransferase [Polyangiaceae bacterium]